MGISLGVMGGLTALVQGVILRKVNPKIGNERSIFYGIGMYSLGMLLFSFAGSSWMMFAILGIYCLGGIAGPSLQSVISTKVSASEQGDLQGALTSIISLTSIIGPPLMTNIFYYFTHNDAPFKFAGAPFFVGFILMSISTYIVYRGFYKNKK